MRRKSERTANKKKSEKSPEKKIEKVKRTRTRRRKQSTSSDNESADDAPQPVQEKQVIPEIDKNVQQSPNKEDSPEDAHDQVWRVKATEGSGDIGEIQKLKICLTRPPSTPERVDRSPRSKRKHSRATSSSDTPSNEGVDEKKKSKHRSKKLTRESKDECDKNHDSQEEQEAEGMDVEKANIISQSVKICNENISDDTPVSTTNEEVKVHEPPDGNEVTKCKDNSNNDSVENSKTSDADTTVASPKAETTVVSSPIDPNENTLNDCNESNQIESCRDSIEDKSEILEIHADENRCETSDTEVGKVKPKICKNDTEEAGESAAEDKVSKISDETDSVCKEPQSDKKSDETDVVESTEKLIPAVRKLSFDATKNEELKELTEKCDESADSSQSVVGENVSTHIVISRKRRWGSRPKLSTQQSLTISTDILKDIIPDVKPAEFEEVIEERKCKREVSEKIEKPILPKIVIDNSQNVENRKNPEKEEAINKDSNISSNRKISIVNDSDSIVARPPSPPRHKQSCILYITNLVRPFTLAQLKNLLQRTGRIVENGFWIDRIKSKCFVKYATEEQAVETRHALHGVTWPVSNPKTLQVDFSNDESFEKAKLNEETEKSQISATPGTVEDWLREQDMKRERGELEKPYERKAVMREWDMGKMDKDKDKLNLRRPDERSLDKRRHRSMERSPEPARKFKKKEEEPPAKLLDDLFRKTKAAPCIYWLPLSAETIAIKEEQRRQHMAENERRLQELRRTHRRH
ncbi:hypothetical protein ACJJTC_012228 [Scirpophaga incertulas]